MPYPNPDAHSRRSAVALTRRDSRIPVLDWPHLPVVPAHSANLDPGNPGRLRSEVSAAPPHAGRHVPTISRGPSTPGPIPASATPPPSAFSPPRKSDPLAL